MLLHVYYINLILYNKNKKKFPKVFCKNDFWTFINVQKTIPQFTFGRKKRVFSFVTIMLSFPKRGKLFVTITFFIYFNKKDLEVLSVTNVSDKW